MCLFSTKWFLNILEMNEWRNKMARERAQLYMDKKEQTPLKLSRKYPTVLSSEVLRSHDSQRYHKGEKDPLALQFMAYDFVNNESCVYITLGHAEMCFRTLRSCEGRKFADKENRILRQRYDQCCKTSPSSIIIIRSYPRDPFILNFNLIISHDN